MPPLEDLKIKLEDLGLSGEQIDQAISIYSKKVTEKKEIPSGDKLAFLEHNFDKAETWQEKARIRAQIMSEKLDIWG